jgi:23S rRNA (uracil1939-C5)-methyltransferase/tRNA (uracil-5-)-methyltransferase
MLKAPRNFKPEPFGYHEEIELEITDLSNLGHGVGRFNDWVVFVPYALPGEFVRARIWRNKPRYSDADLVEVLRLSPDRVEPVCGLFGECGGCQYQHYAYASQLKWKSRQIEQLLQKMAGITVPVRGCRGDANHVYGYRSKLTPHFNRPPHIPSVPIGFQRATSRSIVDVRECPIALASINEAMQVHRKRLKEEEGRYRKGGTLLLRDGLDGVETDMRTVIRSQVGKYTFSFIAGEFFQNNPYMLEPLVAYAVEQASGSDVRFLVDAYCGVGVFGIYGANLFEAVCGIEINEQAIALAKRNATDNGVESIQFQSGHAEAVFDGLEFPAAQSAVILDPPRKGCDSCFLEQLLAYSPGRIVYVSCGPDTQARDAAVLVRGGYVVTEVQPFDLFPQTRHIENVITFEKV